MDNKKRGALGCGGGTFALFMLGAMFVIFKLTHVIDWSWIWVLSPIWFWAGLIIGELIIIGLIELILVARGEKDGSHEKTKRIK